MTLTHLPFSIAPLAVASLLTSPLLPLLLPFPAPGRCFRTWVLTTYKFFYPSLSLRSFAPTSVLLPSIFRKLAGMTLPPTLTFTVHLQKNTRLFLFPLLALLPPVLTFLTVLLPGNRLRSMPLTCDLTFPFLSQRPCVVEPEATSLSSAEPRAPWSLTCPFALLSLPLNCFRLPPTFSSSTAIGPDKVAYPMLKHLPRSGMDFLLHIFNLSWSSQFFPSIWKASSIIPIHKMGKPLDSPASFRPISLTFCVSKLFECIILSRLLFFLESNSILSPRQAGFRPGRSTLDQILLLCQSISDGFNKPGPGSRTILSTIDFSKAFDSVWHVALFHKLISAGLPPCFARWTRSFLSDRRA